MRKAGLIFLCLLSLSSATPAAAPEAAPVFKYRSVNAEFWDESQKLLSKKDKKNLTELIADRLSETKKDSLENSEAQLALARLFESQGLSWPATVLLSNLIQTRTGTFMASQAVADLSDIVKKYPSDIQALFNESLFDIETENLPSEASDFIHYLNAKFNRNKGLANWAEQDQQKVSSISYWGFQSKYDQLIENSKKEDLSKSIDGFSHLVADPVTPPGIKNQAIHQYARLLFENGEHDKAYGLFNQVDMDLRDRGFILLERAWSKYYLKDYSKALGLLTALEAPVFDATRPPETYVLKMLIFKELCYFRSALEVQKQFKTRFAEPLQLVRKRGDLTKSAILVRMAANDRELGPLLSFYNELKSEKAEFEKSNLKQFGSVRNFQRSFDLKIKEVAARIDARMRDVARGVANDLMDWEDQVSFLEYQTRVDSLRLFGHDADDETVPEEIPKGTFENVYWKFTGEFWLDELENIKVSLSSQCGKNRK